MNTSAPHLVSASLALLCLSCGGDASGPTPGGNRLSAVIDGSQFAADPATVIAPEAPSDLVGYLSFKGGDPQGPNGQIAIGLGFVTGPGTYPLGVNPSDIRGGALTFQGQRGFFASQYSGASGSVTISSIGNGRVKGSFNAYLVPVTDPTYGPEEMIITNGQFDAPLTDTYSPPTGDDYGSSFMMKFGGAEWRPGSSHGTGGGTNAIDLQLTAFNGEVKILLEDVVAPGTYQITGDAQGVRRSVFVNISPQGGWGISPLDAGVITITSITPTRIAGSINGVLGGHGAAPATRSIEASFDIRTVP